MVYNIRLAGLDTGRQYYVKVRAKVVGYETSEWSLPFKFETPKDTMPPGPVTSIRFVSEGDSFLANWAAPAVNADGTPCGDISHYNLKLKNLDTGTIATDRTVNPSYTIDINKNASLFIQLAGRIEITVTAVDLSGNEGIGVSAIAQNPPPAQVKNVIASAGVESVGLKWDANVESDLSKYEIHVGDSAAFTPSANTLRADVAAGTNSFTYDTASLSLIYFKIVAVDKFSQRSTPSVAVSAQPRLTTDYDKTPPGVVSGFTVTQALSADSSNSVATISFTGLTDDDLDKYEVQYRKTGETTLPWSFATIPSDQTTAEIKPLPLDTSYDFRIRAVDFNSNKGAWSAVVVAPGVKKTTLPAAPTGLTVRGGTTNLMVIWNASTDPSMANWSGTYEVQISKTTGFASPITIKTSSTLASFISLDANTIYYVRIRSIDPYGNIGAWSTRAQGNTGQALDPLASRIYWADTAPEGGRTNDVWIKIPENVQYRFDGTKWIKAQDTELAGEIDNVRQTADGKNKAWYQTAKPPATNNTQGDLWFDTANGNKLHVWSTSANDWVSAQDEAIQDALDDAADALQTADGKNTIYYSTPPATGLKEGDTWFDNAVIKVYKNGAWVNASDDLDTAKARQAIQIAGSKNKTYYVAKDSATGMIEGDILFDTADGNKQYRYNGATWIAVTDAAIAAAEAAAGQAQQTADKKNTIYYSTPPTTGLRDGDTWFDGPTIKTYRNGVWTDSSSNLETQQGSDALQVAGSKNKTYYTTYANRPTTGLTAGDLLFDTGNKYKAYRYNGSAWASVQDGTIADAKTAADNAKAAAELRAQTFYEETGPANTNGRLKTNDLWIRSTDNQLHRWTGSAWVEIQDDAIALTQANLTTAVGNLQTSIDNVQAIADGKINTFISNTAPTQGLDNGDIWFDTSVTPVSTKVYDGTNWIVSGDKAALDAAAAVQTNLNATNTALNKKNTTYAQTFAPTANLVAGDIWLDTTLVGGVPKNEMNRWDGTKWVKTQDKTIFDVQALADGKAMVFTKATMPTNAESDLGDIWFDTSTTPWGVKVRTGSSTWTVSGDKTARDAATAAQTEAAKKIQSFYTDTDPATVPANNVKPGDLWYKTNDKRARVRASNNTWVELKDTAIDAAQTAADNAQAAANTAITNAQNAFNLADGKAQVFWGGTRPTNLKAADDGDIWVDTSKTPNEIQVWSGTAWSVTGDPATKAIADAANTLAGQKAYTYIQNTAPTTATVPAPAKGDIWIKNNVTPNEVSVYTGSAWVAAGDKTARDSAGAKAHVFTTTNDTAPTSPTPKRGDVWINTATGKTKVHTGTAWVDSTDPEARTLANSKITTYYNATSPTAPAGGFTTGDLWVKTPENRMHRWSGTIWAEIKDSAIDTAQTAATNAMTAANARNRNIYSTAAATGTTLNGYAFINGDTWFRKDANNTVIGMWEFQAGAWIPKTLNNQVIANLDAGKINAGTINADRIGSNSIDASKIVVGGMDGSVVIKDGTITADELAADSVIAGKIATGAVTAEKIKAGEIDATKIVQGGMDGSVVIENGTITATQIKGSTITGDKIAGNTIDATSIKAGSIVIGAPNSPLSSTGIATPSTVSTAKTEAINAAASDATTKANNAKTQAVTEAGTAADTKVANAVNPINTKLTGWTKTGTTFIDGGAIYADSIAAGQIAANAIGVSELAANAVTADKIAANSISAQKLVIGMGENFVNDPNFIADLGVNWGTGSGITITNEGLNSSRSLKIVGSTAQQASYNQPEDSIVVEAGTKIRATVRVKSTGTIPANVVGIGLRHKSLTGVVTYPAYLYIPAQAQITAYKSIDLGIVDIPSDGTLTWFIIAQAGYSSRTIWFDNIQVMRAVGTTVIADDAITTGKIAAQQITGAKIAANTITVGNMGPNSVDNTVIQNGAITTNKIGANEIKAGNIDAGAITADKIAAGSIRIGGDDSHIPAGAIANSGEVVPKVSSGMAGTKVYRDLASWRKIGQNLPGIIVIKTNIHFGNFMFNVEVNGYNYGSTSIRGSDINFSASGYAYSVNNTIPNQAFTNRGGTPISAEMYTTNDATPVVAIVLRYSGDPYYWSYPQLNVSEVSIGGSPSDNIKNGWTIEQYSDETILNDWIRRQPQHTLDTGATTRMANSWAFTGTTEINGGKIKADTITAAQIRAGAITIGPNAPIAPGTVAIPSDVTTAKNEAISTAGTNADSKVATALQTAAADAQTKANAAKTAAEQAAKNYADGEISASALATANAAALDAQQKADAAKTAAESAAKGYTDTTVDPIRTTANGVKTLTDGWKYQNTTYINGGNIYTGTITAAQIKAGSIVVGAANSPIDRSSVATPGDIQNEIAPINTSIGTINSNVTAVTTTANNVKTLTDGWKTGSNINGAKIQGGTVPTAAINSTQLNNVITANVDANGKVIAGNDAAIKFASVSSQVGGQTVIEGGKIKTGTIIAGALATDAVVAGNIKSDAIEARHIKANITLTNDLYVGNTMTINGSGNIKSSNYTSGGTAGFYMDQQQLIINQGKIKAAAIELQDSSNIMPPLYASFNANASAYTVAKLWSGSLSGTTKVSNDGKFGGGSVQFVITSNTGFVGMGTSATDLNIPIEGSNQYIISFYVSNRSSKAITLQPELYQTSAITIKGTATSITNTTAWTRYSVVVTAPASMTRAILRFNLTAGATATFKLDGIQVEQKTGAIDTPSNWSPPGYTSIDGESITTGSISSSATARTNSAIAAWSIDTQGRARFGDVTVNGKIIVGEDASNKEATSIQSDQYSAGIAGWAIKGNGDVEFNNGTFRGMLSLEKAALSMKASVSPIKVFSSPQSDPTTIDAAHIRGVTYSYNRELKAGTEDTHYPTTPRLDRKGNFFIGPTTDRSVNIQVHDDTAEDAVYLGDPPSNVSITALNIGEQTNPASPPAVREDQGLSFRAQRIETRNYSYTGGDAGAENVSQILSGVSSTVKLRSPLYPESEDGLDMYPESSNVLQSVTDYSVPKNKNLLPSGEAVGWTFNPLTRESAQAATVRPEFGSSINSGEGRMASIAVSPFSSAKYVRVAPFSSINYASGKRHIASFYVNSEEASSEIYFGVKSGSTVLLPTEPANASLPAATNFYSTNPPGDYWPLTSNWLNVGVSKGMSNIDHFSGGTPSFVNGAVNIASSQRIRASGTKANHFTLGGTVSFWFKPAVNGNTGESNMYHRGISSSVQKEMWVILNGATNRLQGGIALTGTVRHWTSNTTITSGQWHHIAIVIGPTTTNRVFRVYINGVQEVNTTFTSITGGFDTGQFLHLGADRNLNQQFAGQMGDVAHWETALSSQNIAAIYASPRSAWPSDSFTGSQVAVVPPGQKAHRVSFWSDSLSGTSAPAISAIQSGIPAKFNLFAFQLEEAAYKDDLSLSPQLRDSKRPTAWSVSNLEARSSARISVETKPVVNFLDYVESTKAVLPNQRSGLNIEPPAQITFDVGSRFSDDYAVTEGVFSGDMFTADASYKMSSKGFSYPGSPQPFMPTALDLHYDFTNTGVTNRPRIGGSGYLFLGLNNQDLGGVRYGGDGVVIKDSFDYPNQDPMPSPWQVVGGRTARVTGNRAYLAYDSTTVDGEKYVYHGHEFQSHNQTASCTVEGTQGIGWRYGYGGPVISINPIKGDRIHLVVLNNGDPIWRLVVYKNNVKTTLKSGSFTGTRTGIPVIKLSRTGNTITGWYNNTQLFTQAFSDTQLPQGGRFAGFAANVGYMDNYIASRSGADAAADGEIQPYSFNVNNGRGLKVVTDYEVIDTIPYRVGEIHVLAPGYYTMSVTVRAEGLGNASADNFWMDVVDYRDIMGRENRTIQLSNQQNQSNGAGSGAYITGNATAYIEGRLEFRMFTNDTGTNRINRIEITVVRVA